MKRSLLFVVAIAVFAALPALAGDVNVSKLAFMTFETEAHIDAAPAHVWTCLTDAGKTVSWCPMWKDAKNAQPLTKVGNTVSFVDDWENPGKSVVVFVDAGKELRIAHVPDNGSYVCQMKFTLSADGNGTKVHVVEQYSDALDAPTDKDTAAMMQKEMAGYVAALKATAEKK